MFSLLWIKSSSETTFDIGIVMISARAAVAIRVRDNAFNMFFNLSFLAVIIWSNAIPVPLNLSEIGSAIGGKVGSI